MISTRSTLLLKAVDRQVFNPVFVRHFASPAVRRFKKINKHRQQPTVETAKSLPTTFAELDNATLLTVAALNNHEARCEVLKRHIMSVDMCSYEDACVTFDKIEKKNRDGKGLAALPYQLGIAAGVTAAIGSIPMVFDLQATLWFNEFFVTTEVPGSEDLQTPLEVGSWAWNWMEPPLGTASFVLLCLQFARYVIIG